MGSRVFPAQFSRLFPRITDAETTLALDAFLSSAQLKEVTSGYQSVEMKNQLFRKVPILIRADTRVEICLSEVTNFFYKPKL